MLKIKGIVWCAACVTALSISSKSSASAQGMTGKKMDCGFDFAPHETRQLTRAGWRCDADETAVARRMNKRGFRTKQFVDAYILAHDIPRTTAEDVERIAALSLVDINARYYYMIDESRRPSLTAYYNRKLFRRGSILAAVGYSFSVIGLGLGAAGAGLFIHHGEMSMSEVPFGTSLLFVGAITAIVGTSVGSIGLHKLRLMSHYEILDKGSMEDLRKRRTKTHHFAPNDLIDYQQAAPFHAIILTLAPIVGKECIGIGAHMLF